MQCHICRQLKPLEQFTGSIARQMRICDDCRNASDTEDAIKDLKGKLEATASPNKPPPAPQSNPNRPMRPGKQSNVEALYGKPIRDILLELWETYPTATGIANHLNVNSSTISAWINSAGLARKTVLIEQEPETKRQSRLAEIETEYNAPIRDILQRLINRGLDNDQIATTLSITPQTLTHYFTRAHIPDRQAREREIGRIEQAYNTSLPEVLKNLYDKMGSQTLVAKALDVNQSTVSEWLTRYSLSEKVILVSATGRPHIGKRKPRVI